MSYSLVPLSPENISDLIFLYKKVFGNSVTADALQNKFDTSHLTSECFGHLAYSKGNPVAFHGAIPMLMKHESKYELAAQYGDAMTLSEHTGKGLFTTLGKLTDEKLKAANIRFVWGFPNQNSEYGYMNKMGWQYQERMQRFHIKTSSFPVEKIARKFKFSRQIYDGYISNVFRKYQTERILQGSVYEDSDVVSSARNMEYYRYKSFTGNFTINLNDVLFWIKIKNGLLVGDIEFPSESKFHSAFRQLQDLAASHGIGAISIQSSPDTIISKLMANYTQRSFDSWAVGYKNFNSQFPLERLKLTLGDLDTF